MADQFDFQFKIQGPAGESAFAIPLGESILGRLVGSTLLLESEQVSRRHVQIDCTLTAVTITDLNSSNGTYLNGQKLTPGVPYTLSAGDTIKVGPFLLTLEQTTISAPEPEAPPVQPELQSVPPEPQEEASPAEEKRPRREKKPPAAAEPETQAPPEPLPAVPETVLIAEEMIPPGLSLYSQQLVNYLPGIYQTDFMRRFLGIFESILMPVEWNIDNFDLFLGPSTAPEGFLPWLANWFSITFQPGWTESKRRELLQNAGFIYARRGTRAAMIAILRIFTGQEPQIDDTAADLPPFTFRVKFALRKNEVDAEQIGALIDAHKPAHTSYILEFAK